MKLTYTILNEYLSATIVIFWQTQREQNEELLLLLGCGACTVHCSPGRQPWTLRLKTCICNSKFIDETMF